MRTIAEVVIGHLTTKFNAFYGGDKTWIIHAECKCWSWPGCFELVIVVKCTHLELCIFLCIVLDFIHQLHFVSFHAQRFHMPAIWFLLLLEKHLCGMFVRYFLLLRRTISSWSRRERCSVLVSFSYYFRFTYWEPFIFSLQNGVFYYTVL